MESHGRLSLPKGIAIKGGMAWISSSPVAEKQKPGGEYKSSPRRGHRPREQRHQRLQVNPGTRRARKKPKIDMCGGRIIWSGEKRKRVDRSRHSQRDRAPRGKECTPYKIPESIKAFCKMVSLTAAKTNRMLVVSVAWVRLEATVRDKMSVEKKWAPTVGINSNVLDSPG